MDLCLQIQRGILFPQPAGAPKKRAVSRRRTAPAGRPAAYTPPRVRSGSQSDRLHPGTSSEQLVRCEEKGYYHRTMKPE